MCEAHFIREAYFIAQAISLARKGKFSCSRKSSKPMARGGRSTEGRTECRKSPAGPQGPPFDFRGLSHGLKTCPRHVFLTAFRVPPPIPEKTGYPAGIRSFLVREMGLEPTRRNHTHLKRACLPFQHSRKCLFIIMQGRRFVNHFLLCRTAKISAEFCLKSFQTG